MGFEEEVFLGLETCGSTLDIIKDTLLAVE